MRTWIERSQHLAVRGVPTDLPTTAHAILKFPAATRFRHAWTVGVLAVHIICGPASHGLPRLISLIFSGPFEPIHSRNRVTTKTQPIALLGELTLGGPEEQRIFNPKGEAICLNPP